VTPRIVALRLSGAGTMSETRENRQCRRPAEGGLFGIGFPADSHREQPGAALALPYSMMTHPP
jgi:hypothetical protein